MNFSLCISYQKKRKFYQKFIPSSSFPKSPLIGESHHHGPFECVDPHPTRWRPPWNRHGGPHGGPWRPSCPLMGAAILVSFPVGPNIALPYYLDTSLNSRPTVINPQQVSFPCCYFFNYAFQFSQSYH